MLLFVSKLTILKKRTCILKIPEYECFFFSPLLNIYLPDVSNENTACITSLITITEDILAAVSAI